VLEYRDDVALFRLLDVVLTNLIDGEHLAPDDIVVLTPTGREQSRVWRQRTFGRHALDDDVRDGSVLWSTVHAFKGLERPVVILAELDDEHGDELANYVRAGASRASNHLVVLAAPPVAADIRRRIDRARPRPA
jgi:hypothetical protein